MKDYFGNPVMTFAIKIRINPELHMDRTAALFEGETWSVQKCGNERPDVTLSGNEFNGNFIK